MKNLIISALASVIITGMDFWQFDAPSDRPLIAVAMTLVIFINIAVIEDRIRIRRMKRFWTERFGRMINETKNRP